MKRTNLTTMLFILCWVACLYGCATTRDVQILDNEVRRLDGQLSQIQKEKESNKREMEAFRAELAAFKKEVETNQSSLQAEHQKTRADLLLRLDTLESQIKIQSTGIEEYKEFAKKPSKEIGRIKEDVEVRLRVLEEKVKTYEDRNRSFEERSKGMEDRLKDLDSKMTSKLTDLEKSIPAKEPPPVETKGVPTAAGNLYRDAYEIFQRGDMEGARRRFEAFLKQYPNMELSDNAQFWIGETYFQKKDYEKAILEYEKAIVKYPEGDKVSSALLKQGFSFLELGDKNNARNLLKRVIDRYPQTEQADIAKKKLETIK